MNCAETQTLLSPFFDGELSPPQRELVWTHLESCESCRGELADVAQLSAAVQEWDSEPRRELWNRIAGRLGESGVPQPITRRISAGQWLRSSTVAALLVMAIVSGWLAYGPRQRAALPGRASAIAAVNLGPYFDQISSRRDEPIAGHSCMQMSPMLASRQVSFRVISLQIPDYELSDTDLIRMPSCMAVRMKYERAGEMCQVFQFPRGQRVDLGKGPMLTTVVNDRPVKIVQSGEVFGAAWETGDSTISVVGPKDLSKFMQLVAQVDSQFREMRQ